MEKLKKIEITFEENEPNVGLTFNGTDGVIFFEDLTTDEKIIAVNALAQFYHLFYPAVEKEFNEKYAQEKQENNA